jgi:hypothetical protein
MDSMDKVELTAAEKLAQMEKEKLTRRQALARFGFQAGAAAVAALTADDLLRKVGTEMRKRAGDNKVAQQVASEFEKAGVANAVAIRICSDDCSTANSCCNERGRAKSGTKQEQYEHCKLCCDSVYAPNGQGWAPCASDIIGQQWNNCYTACGVILIS